MGRPRASLYTAIDSINAVDLGSTKVIKQYKIKSSTRGNGANKRHKHEMYEADAGITWYCLLQKLLKNK